MHNYNEHKILDKDNSSITKQISQTRCFIQAKKGPHLYYILITIKTSALCILVANKCILWSLQ